ncbi:MAG TPA: chemotaxis protein CheW [Noviherbaspirillum sp.]|nr:chemotaxis protein CheW [Noviherbaspirillum sp.]
MTLLEFACRDHRFALPLACVRRVVPIAQPMPLPGAPEIVTGILNVGGEIVTVVDFFRRVGIPASPIQPAQRLLMLDMAGFLVGCIVDQVQGVTSREPDKERGVPEPFSGADFVDTIVRLDDGLCIIVDPEKFLFEDERTQLGDALGKSCHETQ